MEWLTALLAFAVTMLMFAIVVSTFVEMIHRIWGMRAQGMQLMLESLYTKVIEKALTNADKPTAEEFARIIMENRATAAQHTGPITRFLNWLLSRSVVTEIPVEVFTQKLADSRIIGEAGELGDNVVKDISQKFVAFGNEISTYFERRARLFSVLVAIAVASVFYINPYKIGQVYFNSPAVAEAVAAMSSDAQKDFAEMKERLGKIPAESLTPADAQELKKAIDELVAEYEKDDEAAANLKELGVPMGWSESGLQACPGDILGGACLSAILGDAFWLIAGGLLLGLGAPFWAEAVGYLTASREVTNKIAAIVSNKPFDAKGGGLALEAAAPAAAAEATPVTTFKLAAGIK